MSNPQQRDADTQLDEVAQNAGARSAALDANAEISNEEARNAVEGKAPNASGSVAPSTAEDHVPSSSEPYASDLPTANAPDPKEMNPQSPNSDHR